MLKFNESRTWIVLLMHHYSSNSFSIIKMHELGSPCAILSEFWLNSEFLLNFIK